MQQNKKIIIIGGISFFTAIIVTIIICTFVLKANYANKFINNVSDIVINHLKNENISGTANFELDVYSSMDKERKIIEDAKYTSNYQIHLKDGYSNIELNGNYKKDKINSNIYIDTNQVYITLEDIYDKNISYNNIEYLKYFTNANDTSKLIELFIEELNNTTKDSNYLLETETKKQEKLNKTTLDITEENNPKLRKNLVNNLIENKEFIKVLSKIEAFPEETIKEKMKTEYLNNYKLILYTTKKNKEFIKAEIKINEIDLKITKKNNKYHYEYYVRDGLEYTGYIEIKNKKIKKINIVNNIYHFIIDIKINELEVKYNQELEKVGDSKLKEQTIHNTEMDGEKEKILKNDTINNIYDNYINRYPEVKEEIIEDKDGPYPTPPDVAKEDNLNRPVINGVG